MTAALNTASVRRGECGLLPPTLSDTAPMCSQIRRSTHPTSGRTCHSACSRPARPSRASPRSSLRSDKRCSLGSRYERKAPTNSSTSVSRSLAVSTTAAGNRVLGRQAYNSHEPTTELAKSRPPRDPPGRLSCLRGQPLGRSRLRCPASHEPLPPLVDLHSELHLARWIAPRIRHHTGNRWRIREHLD